MIERGVARDATLALAVVAVPLLAAVAGARGPFSITLNLGPGDAPYLSGFTSSYEIDDRVATHWTTYDAAVYLPLTVSGGPMALSYRFARVFGETAVVEIVFAGGVVDRFECRGGRFQERTAALGARNPTSVALAIHADSHERQNLGLKLDWIRLTGTGRVNLQGGARLVPALVIALLVALHVLAGWDLRRAALLAAPWAVAAAFGVLRDPWLVHRLLRGVVFALSLFGLAGVVVGRWLLARGRAAASDVRALAALALATFLLRALAVNHPDFYYPDLRTHARLVQVVRAAGLDFFRTPAVYIWEHGVWRTEAYGKTYAFPYTPAFHLPFAAIAFGYDELITAMKLAAAALTTVPLVLVWALARRLGASVLGAALMAVVPTYVSRLSFAFLPALFGHAVDMALIVWFAGHLDRIGEKGVWLRGALLVAACQLAYVSGVVNISLFVAVLAACEAASRPDARARQVAALLTMGLAGSFVSVLVYYRDFLPMVFDVFGHATRSGAAAASVHPVQGLFAVAYARTRDFFDGLHPVLAAGGLFILFRRRKGASVLAAWLVTYLLLLLGRAKMPDVFLHGHETLFVTPLVCLASGEALAVLAARGRAGRMAAVVLGAALVVQGFAWQWRALADQLGNAR
ncbi:MAG: hypothetical protein DMF82_14840 [Acidobacteria bacterium]|nr:MAG: hypothetical protein DMF82_14840 [Acidobacteriota bacterium]